MTLSQEEYEECRIAFNKFDQDGSGKIDVPELRATLQALGQHPTDEELFLMIASGTCQGRGRQTPVHYDVKL